MIAESRRFLDVLDDLEQPRVIAQPEISRLAEIRLIAAILRREGDNLPILGKAVIFGGIPSIANRPRNAKACRP